MFVYEKQLQYPVKIKNPNPALAKLIITQYGGAYSKSIENKPVPEVYFETGYTFIIRNYSVLSRKYQRSIPISDSSIPSISARTSSILRYRSMAAHCSA